MGDPSASYITVEEAERFLQQSMDQNRVLGLGYEQIKALQLVETNGPTNGADRQAGARQVVDR